MNSAKVDFESPTSADVERLYLQRDPTDGLVFIVSGPAGVGKDTVITCLLKLIDHLQHIVTVTTRKMRKGESSGNPYEFVDEAEFGQMAAQNKFLEWAEVHGNLYGTPIDRIRTALSANIDCLLKIDVQGAAEARRRIPQAVLIFLGPPSIASLRRRLSQRGQEDASSIRRRTADAESELSKVPAYDYLVINHDDSADEAAHQLKSIIETERSRVRRRLPEIQRG